MMHKKSGYKTEAKKGEFQPFPVGASEIVLTSVTLSGLVPADRVLLLLEIGWDKPLNWDMGELDIRIRRNSAMGPVIYQMTEGCFFKAHTRTKYEESGQTGTVSYFLTVASPELKARIVGPYGLEGAVYGA
ncbi:hypothetical protein [Paenibacillus mesotrionivorans]|jgi:hypothetical protein|uniref:Uncharacterized protein n=1 Tax=Paenibacillus mesotrionivorans TaxID=3160968 RepID=A0ACC7P1L7_9BACL